MDTRTSVIATTSERSQRRTQRLLPKTSAPWLVFPYGEGMESQAFHNICLHTTCRKTIPELCGKSFWQKNSHHNWLVVACIDKKQEITHNNSYQWNHGECLLWNPVTLESISLPNLEQWISKPDKYVLIDCVLTSAPNSWHDQDKSTVIFIFTEKDDVLLLFCLPGDKQWKTKTISRGNIAGDFEGELISLHCLKGKLYLTFEREDRILEIEKEHLLDDNVKILPARPFELVMGTTRFSPLGADCTNLYYVQSDHEIFKIWVTYNTKCKQVMSIEVWSLDLSNLKWEDMYDFGDHVIFLGMKTGFCCSAAKLGLKSGGMYYTLPDDQSLYRFQGDGGNAVTLPCQDLQTPSFPSEWIMLMPEYGTEGMEDNGDEEEDQVQEQQQQHEEEDFTLKEVVEDNTHTTSDINGSRDKHRKEETSPWDTLHEDAVAAISDNLHPLDYVHYRSVCKTHRRVTPPSTQRRGSSSTGYPYISPWLMFPRDNAYSFVDPVHDNESYLVSFCDSVPGATTHYQKDGWLLMSRQRKVFFHNPFTREIIILPDLPAGYNISIMGFDDSPTTPDCVVFFIDQTAPSDTCILVTVRGDDIWLPRVFPDNEGEKKLMNLHGTAPIFYNYAFYCVDSEGTLAACDLTKEVCWSVLAAPKKIFDNDMHPNLLVECGKDLLLVKIGHLGTSVRIYKLDLSEMEWVKVESLGKYMLFISETSCLSAIAPNSQMENIICFPRVYLNGGGILIYSLETGCYHSSSFAENHKETPKINFYETEGWLSNCTWIQPNWSKSTEQQLDWFKPLQ